MKKAWLVLLLALLVGRPGFAGVVYEIEMKHHEASPPRVETSQMSVEGRHLKMEIASQPHDGRNEMIYRGDRREMVMIDHDQKSYFVMNRETMQSAAQQYNQAMRQAQEALKNVPESQRAFVEQMMKQRMQQMPAQQPERSRSELRKTGERAAKMGYACVKYEIWREGRLQQELWVTDWGKIEGGREIKPVLAEIAAFFRDMKESFAGAGNTPGGFEDSFFEYMEQIDGFPVLTREFDDGNLERESALRSARRQTLDPAAFEPPAGYKRQEMFSGR